MPPNVERGRISPKTLSTQPKYNGEVVDLEEEARFRRELVFADVVTSVHLPITALSYLSLSGAGEHPFALAKKIDPTLPDIVLLNRANQVGNSLALLVAVTGTVQKDEDGTYSITHYGQTLQGIAFHLLSRLTELNKREGTNISLLDLFGKSAHGTNSKSSNQTPPSQTRSPYRRSRIFEMLHNLPESQTLNLETLARKTGSRPSSTASHVQALKEARLITYASASVESKGQVSYTKTEGSRMPENIKGSDHISSDIAALFLTYVRQQLDTDPASSFSAYDITQKLYDSHCRQRSEENRNPVNQNTFSKNISYGLAQLKRLGVFSSTFSRQQGQSHVSLTPKGRAVAELLSDVKSACGDSIYLQTLRETYKREFPAFLTQHGRMLLNQQKEQGKKHEPRQDRIGQILQLLYPTPDGIRRVTIEEIIGVKLYKALTELLQKGIIEKHRNPSTRNRIHGRASIYRLADHARIAITTIPEISYDELCRVIEEGQTVFQK